MTRWKDVRARSGLNKAEVQRFKSQFRKDQRRAMLNPVYAIQYIITRIRLRKCKNGPEISSGEVFSAGD